MAIEQIGVIGAGQMGGGIAQVSALAGYKVAIYDISPERVDAGIATIGANMARQVAGGKITAEAREAAMARISGGADMSVLSEADLVIEAATEDETIKRKIYAQLCPLLKPTAIVAINA